MLQTLITSCLLPTSPSPNHTPFTPTNTPNSWDSNAIHHIQFDGELTEIWQLGRINGYNHVYLDGFFTLFLETWMYETATLPRAWWAFFYIFLSPVGGLSPTMNQTWHFETTYIPTVSQYKKKLWGVELCQFWMDFFQINCVGLVWITTTWRIIESRHESSLFFVISEFQVLP